jgi:hydroxylamine reductase (hybrid-cluster protein)
MLRAGVLISDHTTLMLESLKESARPEGGDVYGAREMGWAKTRQSDRARVRKVSHGVRSLSPEYKNQQF